MFDRFKSQFKSLPASIQKAAEKAVDLMSDNPRHPALRSHKVKKSQGHYGDYVFEADIIQKYRLTWEYGPEKGWISLRNIDNHDECLTKP